MSGDDTQLTQVRDLPSEGVFSTVSGRDGIELSWLADPYRGWQARNPGRRGCGYLCSCAPLEVLHAAGLTPVRLLQRQSGIAQATGYLPSFSCALAQATTERWIRGEFAFLGCIVSAHSCDTLKCLHDIWSLMGNGPRLLTLSLPVVVGSAAAHAYQKRELRCLAKALGAKTGVDVDDGGLRQSIQVYNQQRRLVSELHQTRRVSSYSWRWALTLAGMLLPVDTHTGLLRKALDDSTRAPETQRRGPRVVVSGTVLDDATIPGLLDELGFDVVGDDLCTGQRHYDGQVDEAAEPWGALAEHYARRSPCPGRHVPAWPRSERILEWVRSADVEGVVLVQPKFCDPCAFDDVQVMTGLREASVPYVVVETDTAAPTGQLRTRLQAFSEMLVPRSGRRG